MNIKHLIIASAIALTACATGNSGKIDVILDSDANNELDDQHAIAYMVLNQDTFNILGITTNATRYGGNAEEQCKEARRVLALMGEYGKNVKAIPGATDNFNDIRENIANDDYDGSEAVQFIIDAAMKHSPRNKLVLIPVGKLTNIALALLKKPEIEKNVRIVWLGSNYPGKGEYNLVNDIPSMNYVLDTDAEFEIVTVSPMETGTAGVRISLNGARERFAGKGPEVAPVEGRNGGTFTCFGDYSINLFENIGRGADDGRALYDMACVATVKNPEFAEAEVIPAPIMEDDEWVERPDNKHTVVIWRNFDRDGIINDFVNALDAATKK